jgi:aminoglycoside phosphotransferase (APT) family kinase protein
MCRRAFGAGVQLHSIQEIGGGTFNTVYLIELVDKSKTILRLAPPPTADILWEDIALMRRECQILPFFASIAALLPRILVADFTHQVVGRDYMFQSFIEGERWDYIEADLTPAENLELWRQLGHIVKQIHTTTGEKFGWPYPGHQFSAWSELVIDRLDRLAASMRQANLDTTDFVAILDIVRRHAALLDQVQEPCLLHGDLWLFNILVNRNDGTPQITGIIDVDRAWWGDPMADWLMFLLEDRRGEPEWDQPQAAFWQAYGPPAETSSSRFRREVYKTMHVGSISLWALRNQEMADLKRAALELQQIAQTLPVMAQTL